MADQPTKTATQPINRELDDLAFAIFKDRVANPFLSRAAEHEAVDSYRKAEAFLTVRAQVRSGELDHKEEESPLSDACCPNLPATSPVNLVARLHTDRQGVETPGDVGKVTRIKQWLEKNPTPNEEDGAKRLLHAFNREFRGLSWELPDINTARAIFPAHAEK